ncbi:citrulline utilization hydrolase CtlX [Persicitalea jodogahamensis]|uniref:Amidinotransferase n=1 Tax=Persicitalea jodogahamensis TaxID=402147 RepID=A0A8J3D2H9_9BACT|nr:arginine deiminase-related protein [Persicitalea jodogahamensis]GHB60775.1 hypothetical protein GCM10007390_13120 [Persicitalea jodogahamensis]
MPPVRALTTHPQTTPHIFMVRPVRFAYNEQTSESNEFMDAEFAEETRLVAQEKALEEFEQMVAKLSAAGVDLRVYEDTLDPYSPDSIFPNNWITTHRDGKLVLFPMMAPNRRVERRQDIVEDLKRNFKVEEVIDLTHFEQEEKFLEATGSMVLDRRYKIAYACLSARTHPEVLSAFAEATGYEVVSFSASDDNGVVIYHTNVLMCVGDFFAVICLEAIKNEKERLHVCERLRETGKEVVEISLDQMKNFAGNMLLVQSAEGAQLLVMSESAFRALTKVQCATLESYAQILSTDLSVIEGNGGGSARCMMAEIHLPAL